MAKNAETPHRSGAKPAAPVGGRNGHAGALKAQGASVEELSKRLSEIEGVNEDMAMFLAANWQRLVGGLFVILLVAVLFYQYRNTQATRMSDASQRFEAASSQFGKILLESRKPESSKPEEGAAAKDGSKTDDFQKSETALMEQLKLLQSTQSDSVYGRLAQLYQAQTAIVSGDFGTAREQLSKFRTSTFAGVQKAKTSAEVKNSDLLDELATMEQARLLLAESKDQPSPQARELFRGLALGGRFLNLEALLALFRTASQADQSDQAKQTAQELLAVRPELRDIVSTQLGANGISLD
jgi:hypothetical protein